MLERHLIKDTYRKIFIVRDLLQDAYYRILDCGRDA